MRNILTILFLLKLSLAHCQYVLQWTDSTKASSVSSFDILQSKDSVSWNKIGNLTAMHNAVNNYSFTVPGATYYYQVKVNNTVKPLYSNKVYVFNYPPTVSINFSNTQIQLQ